MQENDGGETSINKSNFSNERNSGSGLLEKLETARAFKITEDINISFLKFSIEASLSKFTEMFFSFITGKREENVLGKKNIGLNVII